MDIVAKNRNVANLTQNCSFFFNNFSQITGILWQNILFSKKEIHKRAKFCNKNKNAAPHSCTLQTSSIHSNLQALAGYLVQYLDSS
jgi:23S rRNA maturation mini-RNase III